MEVPLASFLWRSAGCSDVFREFNRNIISDYTAEDINKKARKLLPPSISRCWRN
jgi:hypothetical protein